MVVPSPIKLLLISLVIWSFIFAQIPVVYLYSGSAFFPVLTLLLYIVCFILGVLSLRGVSIKSINYSSNKKLKQVIGFFFIIGCIGVLLKIYVGFFKSGIFVAEDIFEQRIENMGKELSGGGVGVLASMLFPFAYVAMLMAIYNYKIFNKLFLIVICLFGFYPMIETIFMGGRTILALLGSTLLFVALASFNKNTKTLFFNVNFSKIKLFSFPRFILKKTIIIPVLILGILFVSYSIDVINKRVTRYGYGNTTLQVWEQKNYQWVKFDKDFKTEYLRASEDEKAKMVGLYSLKHYFAHGMIEYVRLVNHLESTTGYYYGQYEFNVFFKFFRSFGIPLKSAKELNGIVERKAVYQTFWGPFYIDFGMFGVVLIFFWGRFVKRIYVYAKRGNTEYVVFYCYLATIIVTSAFINFLLGSSSYYLFAFLTSLLFFKFWPNNLVLKLKN
ncbi:O-antigen polymerase [Algibacter sp. L4_22]|uniref:O-antigen polymerase n=1 Tax=Algibacter sp. L4_22 TaxID=2942477 RepID=UPI00201B5B4A|nr:O-antigen polymerase [Algibacter sp. L4_22]MCL5127258.1 oligosaccharide repeat unit polymerase [Algibacter sp. L4_22]